jgi:hypothetical protein
MTERERLNTKVTEAILRAESLLHHAALAWREVEACEHALYFLEDELGPDDPERAVAGRGRVAAKIRADVLDALDWPASLAREEAKL